jgi:hypothetical protein
MPKASTNTTKTTARHIDDYSPAPLRRLLPDDGTHALYHRISPLVLRMLWQALSIRFHGPEKRHYMIGTDERYRPNDEWQLLIGEEGWRHWRRDLAVWQEGWAEDQRTRHGDEAASTIQEVA